MTKIHRWPPAQRSTPAPETWQDSETLFLLKCYDIWSATPPRGCDCNSQQPAAD